MDFFINFRLKRRHITSLRTNLRKMFQRKPSRDLSEPRGPCFSDDPLSRRRDRLHICDETRTELKRDLVYETVGLSESREGLNHLLQLQLPSKEEEEVGQFVAACY